MRHKIICFLLMFVVALASASAQKPNKDRAAWVKEMQRVKHEYLVKELSLTKEQQAKFFPIYDAMDDELRRLFDETRDMEKQIRKKGDKATDIELERAADAQFNVKTREAAVEKAYYPRLKQVLTKKQLFNLKHAERRFQRKMINEHHKNKK